MYTIICTQYKFGQIVQKCEKDRVKKECERLRHIFNAEFNKVLQNNIIIEVVNNETGEVREYWNNHENKIAF